MRKLGSFLFLTLIGLFLLLTVLEMPIMGDPANPSNTVTTPRYISEGARETNCKNLVSAIMLNYRSYDTMGEMVAIFTVLAAALAILGREKAKRGLSPLKVEPSPLIKITMVIYIPFFIVFACYVAINGCYSVGGGFQGGVILASVIIIFALIFGFDEAVKKFPASKRVFFEGLAVLYFMLLGLMSLFVGGNFLNLNLFGSPVRKLFTLGLEIGIGLTSGITIASLFYILKKVERE
ncbi:MAG TPA: hypothetical protein ENN38_07680 [Actinobacteria bacterium]|nr:hypothetical protein [Actinomycetota bacterium]